MGVWGKNIFDNDMTSDVKDTYMSLLNEFSDDEAHIKTKEFYKECFGTDEEALFWYSLALTQWKLGRLTLESKEKALQLIEDELCVCRSTFFPKEVLLKLKTQLLEPLPKKVEVKKEVFVTNPWNLGDVYAYRFHTKGTKDNNLKGKYILLQKIGEATVQGKTYSIVQFFNCLFKEIPNTPTIIDQLKVLPLTYPIGYEFMPGRKIEEYFWSLDTSLRALMVIVSPNDYPVKHLKYIGNIKVEHIEYEWSQYEKFLWGNGVDNWLSAFYLSWNS